MDPVDGLEQAWEQGAVLLAGLEPHELGAAALGTYTLRDLLNHVVGEALMMTEANWGESGTNDRGDVIGCADTLATWRAVGRDNVTSWRQSGVVGNRAYVYGTFPAESAILINLGEVLVHSWDLAAAMGQRCALDPDLAELVLGLYSSFPLDGLRAGGQFGPEVRVPTDAPVGERLLGLLGRQPTIAAGPAIARATEAETLSLGASTLQLLLDAKDTGDVLSAHRVDLAEGELGANPHRHARISETLFVVDGSIDVLAGEELLTATSGDLVVVPPGHAHAFAASAGSRADLLVMVTPGIDRFPFFRSLCEGIRSGDRRAVLPSSPDLDTDPVESTAWTSR
jgi:uncharacterized protein (TIGR03086 family)